VRQRLWQNLNLLPRRWMQITSPADDASSEAPCCMRDIVHRSGRLMFKRIHACSRTVRARRPGKTPWRGRGLNPALDPSSLAPNAGQPDGAPSSMTKAHTLDIQVECLRTVLIAVSVQRRSRRCCSVIIASHLAFCSQSCGDKQVCAHASISSIYNSRALMGQTNPPDTR
jgi:hypothetical protein